MNSMVEAKWVRIMCDSCADGLWAPCGGAEDADDLPITPELRARLRAWQAHYDEYDPGMPGVSIPDLAAFTREGLEIAREVKRQLPDWTVVYHDEGAASEAALNAPRDTFEYEIELWSPARGSFEQHR